MARITQLGDALDDPQLDATPDDETATTAAPDDATDPAPSPDPPTEKRAAKSSTATKKAASTKRAGSKKPAKKAAATKKAAPKAVHVDPEVRSVDTTDAKRVSLYLHPDDYRELMLAKVDDGADANARVRALLAVWRSNSRIRAQVDRLARTAPRGGRP